MEAKLNWIHARPPLCKNIQRLIAHSVWILISSQAETQRQVAQLDVNFPIKSSIFLSHIPRGAINEFSREKEIKGSLPVIIAAVSLLRGARCLMMEAIIVASFHPKHQSFSSGHCLSVLCVARSRTRKHFIAFPFIPTTTISSYIIRVYCGVGAGSGKFQISQITLTAGAIARHASALSVFAAGADAEKWSQATLMMPKKWINTSRVSTCKGKNVLFVIYGVNVVDVALSSEKLRVAPFKSYTRAAKKKSKHLASSLAYKEIFTQVVQYLIYCQIYTDFVQYFFSITLKGDFTYDLIRYFCASRVIKTTVSNDSYP